MNFTNSVSRILITFCIVLFSSFLQLVAQQTMPFHTIKEMNNKKEGTMGGTNGKADTTHKPVTNVKRRPANAIHRKKVDAAKPTFASIKPLLVKNTCISCHSENKRQVGPAFAEVAKRNYSVDEIVKLVHNPQPEHWPDYSTEMPPMPQVSVAEAKKIAAWIRSLGK